MSGFQAKQVYKNRAEAYRLFIQAQNLPVGQTKFYNDAERLKLICQDKTIELSSLMAYVKEELQIDPTSGQSLVEKELEKRLADLEFREKELKVKKLERDHEKESGRTVDIAEAEQAMARKIIIIYEKIKAQVRRDQEESLHRLGLPPAKAAAYVTEVVSTVDRAFNEMRSRKVFDTMIVGEDDRVS